MVVEISQHQFSICQNANGQLLAILMHLFNCLPTLHLAPLPYTKPRMQPALPLDAHYKSGRLKASAYPHQLHVQMCGY